MGYLKEVWKDTRTTCLHNNQIANDSHYNNGLTTKTIPVFICFVVGHFSRERDKTSKTRYEEASTCEKIVAKIVAFTL